MIIIDSSVWVSLFNSKDSNHNKAKKIFLTTKAEDIIVSDHIYSESMTVFRNKVSETYCINFRDFLNYLDIQIFLTDSGTIRLANTYFFQFKKLSFTDCLILASAKINNYKIATFDRAMQKVAFDISLKKA
jgi:predicted nucleic acid-binding protein